MTVQEVSKNSNNEQQESINLAENSGGVPEQATPTAAESAFAPTATKRVLCVPAAHEWRDGMIVKDQEGAFVAKVLKHEKIGRLGSGDPIFRVTLGDERDNVTAVITRKMENLQDVYVVSSVTPNWSGQPAEPYINKDKKEESSLQIYPIGKLNQGMFGGDYTLKSSQDNKTLMKLQHYLDLDLLHWCDYLWMLQMAALLLQPHGRRGQPAIVRDQAADYVGVSAGESPLLGVCIAYAVDRQATVAC